MFSLSTVADHDQVGEPFRPPAKVVPGDRRIGALSKLAKRLSHRKIRTEEHDDVSARSSTAWEFSNRMEKQATANWVNSGHMPEGLAALTPEDVTPAKPSGGRKKTKKKDTPDAFSPTTTVEGVGYGRKTSGSNAVLGIFASDNSHNPYKMNVATTMDLDESLFDRKAADGQKDAPQVRKHSSNTSIYLTISNTSEKHYSSLPHVLSFAYTSSTSIYIV